MTQKTNPVQENKTDLSLYMKQLETRPLQKKKQNKTIASKSISTIFLGLLVARFFQSFGCVCELYLGATYISKSIIPRYFHINSR